MRKPVSIFIMDVTKSSKFVNDKELTKYLGTVVGAITEWTDGVVVTKARQRYGDEVLLVSENYYSAYLIAFYLMQIWKYKKHRPYFGITFGVIEDDVSNIDLEEWTHPLVKSARNASDAIKYSKRRVPVLFNRNVQENSNRIPVVPILNSMTEMQLSLIREQSPQQNAVFLLYLIHKKQIDIVRLLEKKPATISNQLKKGNSDTILNSLSAIEDLLSSIQQHEVDSNMTKLAAQYDDLEQKIRFSLQKSIP